MTPIVILIRPQMGENIGAVARAMSNFGLCELRLVAPRDGWPSVRASEVAAGGKAIIENVKLYENFASSMADIHVGYATTARPRDMAKRVLSPEIALREIASFADNIKTALVFGPERTGIENEDVILCDNIITIPTNAENPSLNIAQSSVIIGYEWAKANIALPPHLPQAAKPPAPRQEYLLLFEQLEIYLDKADYFRTLHKKPIMWQNLRNMLLRGTWNEQEIRTFRGVMRSLWEYR
jgi:tRNA/rRNA methyltransferase